MTEERWAIIKAVCKSALKVQEPERQAFVSRECRSDPALLAEVESLLPFLESHDFLEPPQNGIAWRLAGKADCSSLIGERIGPYRLEQLLGSGGMANVYLARRVDAQVDMLVAIKIIKRGMDTDDLLRRFAVERSTLANLSHPNIARLLDCGATGGGQPYLIMEHIQGTPINAYCDQRNLSTVDRLRLFQQVCDAVQHAHRHLVAHCDLKPGNILVTNEGLPKLLDFGIARLLGPDAPAATRTATADRRRLLTPEYASPEQVQGVPVTTATDVYSLGIVLYELLIGQTPLRLSGRSVTDYERLIGERDPEPPSKVVLRLTRMNATQSPDGDFVMASPATRPEKPLRRLRRRLLGDLDNIVLVALRRDVEQRYQTVRDLSEDIERYLTGMPVAARRPSVGYRMRKFVGRNRSLTIAAIAVSLALLVGALGTVTGLRRARVERDAAVGVAAFIRDILGSANPYREGRDATVIEMLEELAGRIPTDLADRPGVEAPVRYAVARAYAGLFRWPDVVHHARRALDLTQRLHGTNDATVGDYLTLLGTALAHVGDHEAVSIERRAVALRLRLHGHTHADVAESKARLAFSLWATDTPTQWEEAEALYRDAIATYRTCPDTDARDLALAIYSFGSLLLKEGRLDEAEVLMKEAVALYGDSPRKDRYTAASTRAYATLLRFQDRYDEEALILQDYVRLTPLLFGAENQVRESLWRLALLQQDRSGHAETLATYRRAFAAECVWRSAPSFPDSEVWHEFALAFPRHTRAEQTAALAHRVLTTLPTAADENASLLLDGVADFAVHVCRTGHHESAISLLAQLLRIERTSFPQLDQSHAYALNGLGACLLATGEHEAAKRALVSSLRAFDAEPTRRPKRLLAVRRMIDLYDAWGKPRQAAAYRRMLDRGDDPALTESNQARALLPPPAGS